MTTGNSLEVDTSSLAPMDREEEQQYPDQAPHQIHNYAPNGYNGPYAAPVAPYYAAPPRIRARMPPPPTAAPRSLQWTFESCVSYEVLRSIGYPVDLSQCIAGSWSGIRPYKGFNKGEWNEANRRLQDHYPSRLKGEKLVEFYWCMRRQREADEWRRDQKDRERRARDKEEAEFKAETARKLAQMNAEMGEAQDDTLPSSPAGPSEAPSPMIDWAEEVEEAAPQQEAETSHKRNSFSSGSEGSQSDGQAGRNSQRRAYGPPRRQPK
ncbi:hypothetical protein PG985_004659 [Apiospora marii]|uniref:Uncharacterized protein n=1 Tax=Apiospora marii TaxID=335849 RepID=A0ABR1SC83_9PEZI